MAGRETLTEKAEGGRQEVLVTPVVVSSVDEIHDLVSFLFIDRWIGGARGVTVGILIATWAPEVNEGPCAHFLSPKSNP
jgi:hypothetical protein